MQIGPQASPRRRPPRPRVFRSSCCRSPTSRAIRGRTTSSTHATDELTTSLARLRYTFVIARNTAMTFEGQSRSAPRRSARIWACAMFSKARCSQRRSDEGQRPTHRRRQRAHLWAEQFDTPAPICCRRRTRSSRIWRARNRLSSLPRPRAARLRRGALGQSTPQTWLSNATRGYGRLDRSVRGARMRHIALCEQALAIDPNNVSALMGIGEQVLHAGGAWWFQRPQRRP